MPQTVPGPELCDRTTAPHSLKVRRLKAEVIKSKLRTAYHQVRLRVIGFQDQLRTERPNHPLVREGPQDDTRCESIETTFRKWRLFFAGAVAPESKDRLTNRVMFGTMAGGKNPRPGEQCKTWHRCIVADLFREFRATEGSTEYSVYVGMASTLYCRKASITIITITNGILPLGVWS